MNILHYFFLAIFVLLTSPAVFGDNEDNPKLVVLLIVDQLPMDRVVELADWERGKGFKRLFNKGLVYEKAYYDYATTSTAPGHATIATGLLPSQHGIIANSWMDHETSQETYSTTDSSTHLLGTGDRVVRGASPHHLMAKSFADTLMGSSPGSLVYGVSLKDRGAIFTAGQKGKAFWYGAPVGRFLTSDYYYNKADVPEWLHEYNEKMYEGFSDSWTLLMDKGVYQEKDNDAPPYERPPAGLGKTFPHSLAKHGTREYYNQIARTPPGDVITINLAKEIIKKEYLGQDALTDFLSISLSVTDRIGHSFGPNSLEAEDNLYRLDTLLNDFLIYLDDEIGRKHFIFVLTADHGIIPVAESIGIPPNQRRIFPARITTEINTYFKDSPEIKADLVKLILGQNVYLDHGLIKKHGYEIADIADKAASWFETLPPIARALPTHSLDSCMTQEICRFVGNTFYKGRSGDIYLVQKEGTIFSEDPPEYSANHGSPYPADRHIPVIFYGKNLPARRIRTEVSPAQIAPSLYLLLDLETAEGVAQPLPELIQ